jgi:hypothetical protein
VQAEFKIHQALTWVNRRGFLTACAPYSRLVKRTLYRKSRISAPRMDISHLA